METLDRMDWYVVGGSGFLLVVRSAAEEVEVAVEEIVTILA